MRTEDLEKLPQSIQQLVSYLAGSDSVSKIILFGSRARGDHRDNSDFDIAVCVQNKEKWHRLTSEIDQQPLTLLPVDLVDYDQVSEDYRKNIDKEGVVLYVQSGS